MTLDEAIVRYEQEAMESQEGVVFLEHSGLPVTAEKYRKQSEEIWQLVEWLKELKELRGEPNE